MEDDAEVRVVRFCFWNEDDGMATPLERLIDACCKPVDPNHFIWIRCPICLKEKRVFRDRTDPSDATEVVYPCDDCNEYRDGFEVKYERP